MNCLSQLCGRHEHCIFYKQFADPPLVCILAEVMQEKICALGRYSPSTVTLSSDRTESRYPSNFPVAKYVMYFFEGLKCDGHPTFRFFHGFDAWG
jgi:hypothetical protein